MDLIFFILKIAIYLFLGFWGLILIVFILGTAIAEIFKALDDIYLLVTKIVRQCKKVVQKLFVRSK